MLIRGGWLLLLLMLALTVYDLGWISFRGEEGPALSVSDRPEMQVLLLGTDGRLDGIHQINDARQLIRVINLAKLSISAALRRELLSEGAVVNGKVLKFQIVNDVTISFESAWMPAALRMALGIPLDVDEMSESDWDDLPGTGASLARRLEEYRQENGGYGSFSELEKVKGVGPKRAAEWRIFFDVD